MTADETTVALAEAVTRLSPLAETLLGRARWRTPGESAGEPGDFLESLFPVACVAVPGLCLEAVCRYVVRHAGALPPGLQAMAEGAATGAGRPVRGACIAWRGRGLLLADQGDAADEVRFSLMHEGSHFLLDHYLPRQDAVQRLGDSIRLVLDGQRPPTLRERFDALLRGASLEWHSHLYERNAAQRSRAEADADALACLLIAPPSALGMEAADFAADADQLAARFGLPHGVAARYAAALALAGGPKSAPPKNPLLARLGL